MAFVFPLYLPIESLRSRRMTRSRSRHVIGVYDDAQWGQCTILCTPPDRAAWYMRAYMEGTQGTQGTQGSRKEEQDATRAQIATG